MSQSATLYKDREGDSHWVLGDRYTFKATGAQTNGRFMLLEALFFPGNGPPPHRHSREDETFFVLDGELEFMVSGEIHKLGKGGSVYLPEGVLHTFGNTTESPATVLILTTPAGIEDFFVQIGTPVSDLDETAPAQEDVAKVMELAPKCGIAIEVPE
jgi:quercetin dioxygenase-like cupin family protein